VRPGERLKEIRVRLGITTRDVARLSAEIAAAENNPEFAISNPWLTQIENTDSVPSIHKLYSVSVIYRVKFTDLLLLYGVDLENTAKHQLTTKLKETHLAEVGVYDNDRSISFPVRFDVAFRIENTSLLGRMIEVWGEIPIGMIRHLDLRRHQYGYIGLADYTMYPLLRPGSFVQIDDRRTKIYNSGWHTEFERPIYFFELRKGYACSWCERQGRQLVLLPHPASGCSSKSLQYPDEVDILGQVVGIAMRIVSHEGWPRPPEPPRLPKQP